MQVQYKISAANYWEAVAFHQAHSPYTKANRRAVLIVLVPLVVSVVLVAIFRKGPPPPPPGEPGPPPQGLVQDVLLPVLPWLGVFVGAVVFTSVMKRVVRRRAWEGQPELHRPHQLETSESGLVISSPNITTALAWGYFLSAGETPNLFLLSGNRFSFHIVPKAAFATPDDVAAFRALLRSRIAEFVGPKIAPGATAAITNGVGTGT